MFKLLQKHRMDVARETVLEVTSTIAVEFKKEVDKNVKLYIEHLNDNPRRVSE